MHARRTLWAAIATESSPSNSRLEDPATALMKPSERGGADHAGEQHRGEERDKAVGLVPGEDGLGRGVSDQGPAAHANHVSANTCPPAKRWGPPGTRHLRKGANAVDRAQPRPGALGTAECIDARNLGLGAHISRLGFRPWPPPLLSPW